MSDAQKFNTKIVLIGDPKVGKTSLRRSYIGQSFASNYLATIGADFSVFYYTIETDGDTPNILTQNAIWDIAGQDKYSITYPQYFRGAQAAIIVYDITDESTFENVDYWLDKFTEFSNVGKVISLVGNKSDLLETEDKSKIIDMAMHDKLLLQLVGKYPQYIFSSYRTSAKTGKNIKECVNSTVDTVVDTFKKIATAKKVKAGKFEDYIVASYITAYDDFTGPTIIKKSPNYGTYSDKEYINSIKVASTIDMDALGESPNVEGNIPWNEPPGNFHYIAFTDILTQSKKIFIIGFVNVRDINDIISSRYQIISGYFHKAMNDFNIVLKRSNRPIEEISAITLEFDNILLNLRINVFKAIENDL